MAAVFGAFVKYIVQMIYFIAVAGAGIFCGKKLHDKKQAENDQK